MAQSGFVPSLMSYVDENGIVDRMLQKSAGQDTRIQNSMRVGEDGRVYITPDETRITAATDFSSFFSFFSGFSVSV